MIKKIMISGPHGIGKTTTAKALAERFPNFTYVPSLAGNIAKEMNYDLNANPTHEEMIEYQKAVLKAAIFSYKVTERNTSIYDRSPLDFLAYVAMAVGHEKLVNEYYGYAVEVFEAMYNYCDILLLPQADLTLPYENKDNRPVFSKEQIEYRKKYNSILLKAATSLDKGTKVIEIPADYQQEDRVQYIVNKFVGA